MAAARAEGGIRSTRLGRKMKIPRTIPLTIYHNTRMAEVEDTAMPLGGPLPDSRFRSLSLGRQAWANGERASRVRAIFVFPSVNGFTNLRCFHPSIPYLYLCLYLCTPSPSPNLFFLFDIFWLFAVLRNQVIFRKLEEQETRTLRMVRSIPLCTYYHTVLPPASAYFFYFLPQSPLKGKWSLGNPSTSNPKIVQSHFAYINGAIYC